MYWNYRIFKQENGLFGVHEVFYNSGEEETISWTVEPDFESQTLENLLNVIEAKNLPLTNRFVIDEARTIARGYIETRGI